MAYYLQIDSVSYVSTPVSDTDIGVSSPPPPQHTHTHKMKYAAYTTSPFEILKKSKCIFKHKLSKRLAPQEITFFRFLFSLFHELGTANGFDADALLIALSLIPVDRKTFWSCVFLFPLLWQPKCCLNPFK